MPSRLVIVVILTGIVFLAGGSARAEDDARAPVTYTVTFPADRTHVIAVEARVPAEGRNEIVVFLPVWTPGSYLVREYARHIEGFHAVAPDGSALTTTKTSKNRWRIECAGYPRVLVRYRLYCREMSVRTNWVDDEFALINGAPTFVTLVAHRRPHEVRFVPREGWERSLSALPAHPDGRPHHYRARDYDELVDSPTVLGNPTVHERTVNEVPHRIVDIGDGGGGGFWDGARAADDIARVAAAHHAFWGAVPYDRYTVFNLLVEKGGGLEHLGSTVVMTSRWYGRVREKYVRWLGLASHEIFHAWNGKRLRPIELGPFDYEKENYTESLWVVEGITSYYDDLLLHRGGLVTEEEYLEALSRQIERLQTTPARQVDPLAASSFDAWVRFYRRDENTPNRTISYYTKGAVVAFLLDARIRRASAGERSLDDVVRRLYRDYSGERGYRLEDFERVASEVAGSDLTAWFDETVRGTGELDYGDALALLGLRFVEDGAEGADGSERSDQPGEIAAADDDHGGDDDDEGEPPPPHEGDPAAADPVDEHGRDEATEPEPGWLGLETRQSGDRLIIDLVENDTPARRHGLQVDDEIVAVDGYRVLADEWDERREQYRPGDAATVLVARRERLIEVPVVFAEEPETPWSLVPVDDPTPFQEVQRRIWLTGDAPPR